MPQYRFNGQDITLDILMKTEAVVRILSAHKKLPFDTMLGLFYASKTYRNLKNVQSGLWAESSEFIADDYDLVG